MRKSFVLLCVAAVGLAIVNQRTTGVNAQSGPLSRDAVYGDRQGVLHAHHRDRDSGSGCGE